MSDIEKPITNGGSSAASGAAKRTHPHADHPHPIYGVGEAGPHHGQDYAVGGREYMGGAEGRSPHLRTIANPAPLGLLSFASTTLVLSLVNVQARGVTEPNIVVSLAFATGGLAQLLAGMWEFVCGNTFGATGFSSYGAFWISYALILTPGTGILTAYEAQSAEGQLPNALGFFLLVWFIFTFVMFLASLRSTIAISALFFFLDLTFLLLFVAEFTGNVKITKAGGAFGILTAFIAYYAGASPMMTRESTYVLLPEGELPKYKEV